ncbi:MAG TPA: hypothetical protein DCF84_03145 [Bacteroidetes bacterium]|nr:hypothetical protein [Bacteroidota bacterium]
MIADLILLTSPSLDQSTFGIVLKIFGGCALVAILATSIYSFWLSKKTSIDFNNDGSKAKVLNLTSLFLRFFLASLLIFSGAVKIVDPLGTSYKMQDYYTAFDAQMSEAYMVEYGEAPPSDIWYTNLFSNLKKISVPTAVFMVVLEVVLGVLLFLGIFKRSVIPITAAMLVFFTFLTGYTAQTGEPSDCGCFGDFIKLRPIDSFYKDIILCIVIAVLWMLSSKIRPMVERSLDRRVTLISVSTICFLFAFSNYMFGLPIVDFRPYKVGSDIGEKTVNIPDEYRYGFGYENKETGEKIILSDEEFANEWETYSDTNSWSFLDRQEELVKEGSPAELDFSVLDSTGNDLAQEHFNYEGVTLWVVSGEPLKASKKRWESLNELMIWANEKAHRMHAYLECGAKTPQDVVQEIEDEHEIDFRFPCYASDGKVLKTAIRANPGLIILKDGVVLAKYHHTSYPTTKDLENLLK